MYFERVKIRMHNLHAELSEDLEVSQMVDLLMKSSAYPNTLKKSALLCREDLIKHWPSVSHEMEAMLAPIRTGLEQAEPLAVFQLAQKHYRVLAENYPTPESRRKYLADQCPLFLNNRLYRPEATAWLSAVLEGREPIDSPTSQRFLKQSAVYHGVQYRGEHGDIEHGLLQSRLSQYSFSTEKVARAYALNPNNRDDNGEHPRLIEAEITLSTPFIMETSCFVDMGDLRPLFENDEAYIQYAKGKLDYLCNTDNFYRVQEEYGLDEDMAGEAVLDTLVMQHGPDVLSQFYLDAYVVFDDTDIVQRLKSRGYDGVAHAGNAVSALTMEYKVFFPDQIKLLRAVSLANAREQEISIRQTLADRHEGTLKPPLRRG